MLYFRRRLAMKYDFNAVESKWQKKWEEAGAFLADDRSEKPKC